MACVYDVICPCTVCSHFGRKEERGRGGEEEKKEKKKKITVVDNFRGGTLSLSWFLTDLTCSARQAHRQRPARGVPLLSSLSHINPGCVLDGCASLVLHHYQHAPYRTRRYKHDLLNEAMAGKLDTFEAHTRRERGSTSLGWRRVFVCMRETGGERYGLNCWAR